MAASALTPSTHGGKWEQRRDSWSEQTDHKARVPDTHAVVLGKTKPKNKKNHPWAEYSLVPTSIHAMRQTARSTCSNRAAKRPEDVTHQMQERRGVRCRLQEDCPCQNPRQHAAAPTRYRKRASTATRMQAERAATNTKRGRAAASTLCAEGVGRGSMRTSQAKQASETEANPGRRCRADHEPVAGDRKLADRFCP